MTEPTEIRTGIDRGINEIRGLPEVIRLGETVKAIVRVDGE